MSRTEVFGFHVRVHACSVYNMKYQEQRHKTGDYGIVSVKFCGVPIRDRLLFFGVEVCLSLTINWQGFSRMTKATCSTNSTTSRHLKTTMFLEFRKQFGWPQFPKLWLLRCQNFLKVFLPFCSIGFCLQGLGHRGVAPEARHRCTTQSSTGTLRSSSGSSRPRQWWMRRTKRAVASDEGILGKENPPEAMGSLREEVDEQLMVQFFL